MRAEKYGIRGVKMHVEQYGQDQSPTIVLLHGFTGSTSTWTETIRLLSSTYHVVAIDLLGHGRSEAPVEISRYRMEQQIKDLHELFAILQLACPIILGYSMGGRVALAYTVTYPSQVAGLILESSSPGLRSEEEQKTRRLADAKLAERIEQEGLESFIDFWQEIPLFHSQKNLSDEQRQAVRQERLSQKAIGLANSLRGIGTGSQRSYWEDLEQVKLPVLLMTGSEDPKFVEIAHKMKQYLPFVRHEMIKDAGHAIHVEKPRQFATMIKSYLKAQN
ncbi:2-succinyl-6-hydroxy-2,4-cyclohexadiene-1-carboxylate synthase [Sporosarcina sp. PTS2304]|uniref:2-succinyl-6-hydroxy-2, 4-cyclohexadiene-1-carboxylate synthase n=1 Tax=Sporosarcina sp. PTS2304 TaxID=2283194 RepID=UPI000E0D9509|nr:2-succinyl-6-hydroxy-2,4-cyclohexadiene-1-carboxylate synthase [Sporosarcina sp. PTS2304]AXH99659.1 2-succinyl-6-hydroxy-2,4-cyclohexadiene-1-carboxylate synthase [Sporosarcina sp. PTS2304]